MTCSQLSLELGEDMAGTAPSESRILVVERSGPWERNAVPPELEAHAARSGARVQMVRRELGRYECAEPAAWLWSDGELQRLASPYDDSGTPEDEPLVLVCTHSTRDACCARLGLPLHRAVAATGARTWHASHLGGHRFAPTMAVLPAGVWLGRVPAAAAAGIIGDLAAGRLPLQYMRGTAGHPPAVQAAELHVRRTCNLPEIDAELPAAEALWEPTGTVRPLSCGEGAKTEDPGRWSVVVSTLES